MDSIQEELLREILETLRRIENKLDRAGVSVLADIDVSNTITTLMNLLTEPKVIDLLDKFTKILNILSLIDEKALINLAYVLECLSKAMSTSMQPSNIPNVTLEEFLRNLSSPEYGKAMGILLMTLRSVSNCARVYGDDKGSDSGP